MIDIQRDELIALVDLPGILPATNGRKVHKSTAFRWASRGVRGHVLETLAVGGRRFTSRSALDRFLAALNEPQAHEGAGGLSPRPQDAARLEAEEREAEALGL